jgi:hypothetical protein
MIRLATRSDLTIVTELIVEFLQSTSYRDHAMTNNPEHIKRLMYAILHSGYIWLYFNGLVCVGLLVAAREQNMWIPEKHSLREVVWYVREEYRKTLGAGKLFIEFCKTAEQLLEQGEIDFYFTTRMTTTDDYDLERRGFRMTEKLYIKD